MGSFAGTNHPMYILYTGSKMKVETLGLRAHKRSIGFRPKSHFFSQIGLLLKLSLAPTVSS